MVPPASSPSLVAPPAPVVPSHFTVATHDVALGRLPVQAVGASVASSETFNRTGAPTPSLLLDQKTLEAFSETKYKPSNAAKPSVSPKAPSRASPSDATETAESVRRSSLIFASDRAETYRLTEARNEAYVSESSQESLEVVL